MPEPIANSPTAATLTPPKTADTQAPVKTRGAGRVDGAAVTFFKGVGKRMASAFKAIGEGISNLAPKHKPTSEQLSPGSKAAFAQFRELAKRAETLGSKATLSAAEQTELKQVQDDLKAARKDVVQHLRAQFLNGQLYAAAQTETNKTVLDTEGLAGGDPAQTLKDNLNWILHSASKIDMIMKHNMKIDEAVAIYTYTGGSYAGINKDLRSGTPSPFIQQLSDSVTSGLARLPPFEGAVYRIVSLPASIDQQYQEGSTVSDRGILSTTFNVDFDLFGGGTSHVVSILGSDKSAGRDISWLSESPHEKEVIFPPGTKFVVAQRDQATMPQVIGTLPDGKPQFDSQVGLLLVQKS